MDQDNHRRDKFAEECKLEEYEVGPETALAHLSCFGVWSGGCRIFTHMENEPCKNHHQAHVEEVDEDKDYHVASRVQVLHIHLKVVLLLRRRHRCDIAPTTLFETKWRLRS